LRIARCENRRDGGPSIDAQGACGPRAARANANHRALIRAFSISIPPSHALSALPREKKFCARGAAPFGARARAGRRAIFFRAGGAMAQQDDPT
jgi:hypothetical protein